MVIVNYNEKDREKKQEAKQEEEKQRWSQPGDALLGR